MYGYKQKLRDKIRKLRDKKYVQVGRDRAQKGGFGGVFSVWELTRGTFHRCGNLRKQGKLPIKCVDPMELSYNLCKYLLLIAIKGIYFGRQCAQCFYIHDVKHLLPDDMSMSLNRNCPLYR